MAVRFLLDADLPKALYSGLRRKRPVLDVIRVQQVGLRTAEDERILAFAADEGRIVVSKDKATMRDHAADRLRQRAEMPGLLIVRPSFLRGLSGLGEVIAELCRIDERTESADWENLILFIPVLNPRLVE